MSDDKKIKQLSESMLKAFGSKVAHLRTESVEQTEVQKLEEKLELNRRQMQSARKGGFGDLKKMSEEKARLEVAISEARKLSAKDIQKAIASDKAKAKPKDKVSLKKAPWDVKEEVELDEATAKLSDLEKGALKSALGFGGAADPKYKKVIEKLKKMGYVKDIQLQKGVISPEQDTYYYNLTQKGKEAAMVKESVEELDEATVSVYKPMSPAAGKTVSNRVQVKSFKDVNAMGAFLSKQSSNDWKATDVEGLKSGTYKMDMVRGKDGKPARNFIKEEVELDEAPQPKWKVQIGQKHYTVTARNTAEANTKAKKLATKDGNSGVGGKIERIAEEVELDEARTLAKKNGYEFIASDKDESVEVKYKNKFIARGGFDRGADGWFMSIKGERGQKFFRNAIDVVNYFDKNNITEALDPVNPKAVKKKFDDRKDKDLDNDGDTDSSDEYLHKRRKAISKALAKEEVELDEAVTAENKKNAEKVIAYAKSNKGKGIATKTGDNSVIPNIQIVRYLESIGKVKNVAELPSGRGWSFELKEEVELDEAKDNYTINHKTFSSAVQHAKAQAEKQGYTIEGDEWDRKVAMGPKKPSAGKTNRYTIELMKGGKPTKRMLQMQVYYDEGRYELNMYIS